MLICKTCGKEFSMFQTINGVKVELNQNRKKCLECKPYSKSIYRKNWEERACKVCKKLKNRNDFRRGKGFICKGCELKKAALRLKLKAISYLGGKCSKCGFKGHPAAFDFHHVSGEKSFEISESHGWKNIKEELLKCELLCRNCHSVEHASYDEDFILWAITFMEKSEDGIIENYEFIKDLNKETNSVTE